MRSRPLTERAAAAGLDALMFSTLVLLAGTLLVVNLWSVVETRTALDAAAREYLRTYTSASDGPTAAARAEHTARSTLRERRTPMVQLEITPPDVSRFGPCQVSTVQLVATVPAMRLPFVADVGSTTVEVTASEMVPPHRELLAGPAHDLGSTPCDG